MKIMEYMAEDIVKRDPAAPDLWHVYHTCRNPFLADEIVVCSVSMFRDQIIDWAAYVGKGQLNEADVRRVAAYGHKTSEDDAKKCFPAQKGKYRW